MARLLPSTFAENTIALLELEAQAEREECSDLLKNSPQSELQAHGIALLKLRIADQSVGLYGRASLTFERATGHKEAQPLPSHKFTHGDIVGIFDSERPIQKANPAATGIVHRVRTAAIVVVFDEEPDHNLFDGRHLHLALVASDVTLKRYRDALTALSSHDQRGGGCASNVVSCAFGEAKPRFLVPKESTELLDDTSSPPELEGGSDGQGRCDVTFRSKAAQSLNEPQQGSVRRALCAQDLMVIHGPPGTGKTTTCVAYILEAAMRRQRILVCAPSNVAVDNLLQRVIDEGWKSVVRIGHPARIDEALHKFALDDSVARSDQAALCKDIRKEIDASVKKLTGKKKLTKEERKGTGLELGRLRKELRVREERAVGEVLKKTQIVMATCAGASQLSRRLKIKDDDKNEMPFDVVLIDEAAQGLEVACWIPLLLGKKCVLAGDHQQLAACVKSDEAQSKGLDKTLFARMHELWGDGACSLLSIQYRMNEIIMGWSSDRFYESKLLAADCVASRTLPERMRDTAACGVELDAFFSAPLLFVDTTGTEGYLEDLDEEAPGTGKASPSFISASRCNRGEAKFIMHYAKLLVQSGLPPQEICVITPYNKQVELLRTLFAEDDACVTLGLTKMPVNTVDSFQGREADAILLSLVRSNPRKTVGFLADYRRLNVAVTRARRHCCIVADSSTICNDDMLNSLYEYASGKGKIAYVMELLDEDGHVPFPDSAVAVPQKGGGVKGKAAPKSKAEKPPPDHSDEANEARRKELETQLEQLMKKGGKKDFKSTLTSWERMVVHDICEKLGLQHSSHGEGKHRFIRVDAGVATKPAEPELNEPEPVDENAEDDASDSDDGPADLQTRLKALQETGGHLDFHLKSAHERMAVHETAAALGLEHISMGEGKKKFVRVKAPVLQTIDCSSHNFDPPSRETATEQKQEDSPEEAKTASSSTGAADAGGGGNDLLKQLAAERQSRTEARQAEIKAREEEFKAAKRAAKVTKKQTKAEAKADDEDIDALLQEMKQTDGVCAHPGCGSKITGVPDALSLCKFCNKKFCLTHRQFEVHGCAEAASKDARKTFQQAATSSQRSSGLANASFGDTEWKRNQAKQKLQDKIKKDADSRTAKAKPKKK